MPDRFAVIGKKAQQISYLYAGLGPGYQSRLRRHISMRRVS